MTPTFEFYAGAQGEYFGVQFGMGPWMRTVEAHTGFGVKPGFAAGPSEWQAFESSIVKHQLNYPPGTGIEK